MSEISDRLLGVISYRTVSYGDLAKATGIPKSALQRYATGETEKIPIDRLEKIADALNVSTAYLMGWTDEMGGIKEADCLRGVLPIPQMNKVPLIGTIACGTPLLAIENVEDEVDIPEHIHADFALRCKGDSMIGADIQDGDIVYIKQQNEVLDGQIAAVLIGDEATLKRFHYDKDDGVVTLVSENSSIKPMVYHGETLDHIKILGRAVGLTREI